MLLLLLCGAEREVRRGTPRAGRLLLHVRVWRGDGQVRHVPSRHGHSGWGKAVC